MPDRRWPTNAEIDALLEEAWAAAGDCMIEERDDPEHQAAIRFLNANLMRKARDDA